MFSTLPVLLYFLQIERIVDSGICNNFTISQFLCPSRFKSTTNRGKVLREITNDFNEGGVVRVHPKTIQRYLHKNKIFRHVVRKKMVVREVNKND
jgi:hypothetical protein